MGKYCRYCEGIYVSMMGISHKDNCPIKNNPLLGKPENNIVKE